MEARLASFIGLLEEYLQTEFRRPVQQSARDSG
jgi:hypothetical protein